MKSLTTLAAVLLVVPAMAQSKFGIRKTYDGSSTEENKPASASYNRDFETKQDFYTLDLGVKFTEFEILPNKNAILTAVPKIEYHADKRDTFKIHTLAGGVNIQFQPFSDHTPWVLGSVDYQGDFVKESEIIKTKAYVSYYSTKGIRSCFDIRNKDHDLILRYFPYLGYEHYNGVNRENDGSSSFLAARLYAEFIPFPAKDSTKIYFRFIGDFSYRWEIDDQLYEQKDISWLALSGIYYPTGQDKFGIGIDYSVGYDPASNFGKADRLSVSLKVKI